MELYSTATFLVAYGEELRGDMGELKPCLLIIRATSLVCWAADQVYPGKVFSKYGVPGNNIVIADGKVARVYKLGLNELAVNIQIGFWKALSGLFNAERSTCTIDPHNFCKRLEGLYYGLILRPLAVPRVPDTKASFGAAAKNYLFLCPEDQANVLETVKDSVRKVVNAEMTIHVKKENCGRVELMDDVLDAIRIQPTHGSLVAGYNTAEVPEVGYFCTWTEKLKKKFWIFDITDGLSEVFSVKDDIALANMKAASSLASSVMQDFVVREIVHMFGDELAPHSELANDMVEFIHDEAEAVGLNKENVLIHGGRPVFQSGCGWVALQWVLVKHEQDDSHLPLKAQKAAISVLRPGNKISAAYQEAVSVVAKEAPEFAPHLTESAGSGIDLELYDSRRLSLDASNERVLEVGMVFNVSLGFENLQYTDYEAEYPKSQIHYVPSEDVWDDAVDSNNNCDNVVRLIQVDEKMEAVFLPFLGSVVPFHISCIRRVVGHSGERDDQYYLEVFFNTDDDEKMQLGPEAPSYLQKLMFYFESKGRERNRQRNQGASAQICIERGQDEESEAGGGWQCHACSTRQ
ncbi:FACT complex subunit spt16 [Asimina triloba]